MLFYFSSHWLSIYFWYSICKRKILMSYLLFHLFSYSLRPHFSHLHVGIAKLVYIYTIPCNHKQMYFVHKLIVNIENNNKKNLFTLWLWKFCSLLYLTAYLDHIFFSLQVSLHDSRVIGRKICSMQIKSILFHYSQ